MCRLGSLDSGKTLVPSSYEHRDELLGLKIQILWSVILCWLLNRSSHSLSLSLSLFLKKKIVGLMENIFSLSGNLLKLGSVHCI